MTDDERLDYEPAAALLGVRMELDGIPPNAWTEGLVSELALRLDRVSGLIAKLSEVRTWLELDLADRMEADYVPIPGVGRLHRTEFTSSGWKYDGAGDRMREDLANAVAMDVALDVATGEVEPMKRNVALAAIRAVYEAIPAFSSLKAAGPKRFGVRISDYRNYSKAYRVAMEVGE